MKGIWKASVERWHKDTRRKRTSRRQHHLDNLGHYRNWNVQGTYIKKDVDVYELTIDIELGFKSEGIGYTHRIKRSFSCVAIKSRNQHSYSQEYKDWDVFDIKQKRTKGAVGNLVRDFVDEYRRDLAKISLTKKKIATIEIREFISRERELRVKKISFLPESLEWRIWDKQQYSRKSRKLFRNRRDRRKANKNNFLEEIETWEIEQLDWYDEDIYFDRNCEYEIREDEEDDIARSILDHMNDFSNIDDDIDMYERTSYDCSIYSREIF